MDSTTFAWPGDELPFALTSTHSLVAVCRCVRSSSPSYQRVDCPRKLADSLRFMTKILTRPGAPFSSTRGADSSSIREHSRGSPTLTGAVSSGRIRINFAQGLCADEVRQRVTSFELGC